jgi:chromosome segregation ATPase
MKAVLNEEAVTLRQAELDHEKGASDLTNYETLLRDTRKRLEGLEEELTYLVAKEDFLTKEIDVDEGMKQVKIEQLSTLMHSNSNLNETIGSVMSKWDQIIKFTREPPTST